MSTQADEARRIAERIARRVGTDKAAVNPGAEVTTELAAVRAGLSQLQQQLAQIEARVSGKTAIPNPPLPTIKTSEGTPQLRTQSPWLTGVNAMNHPSQDRFGVEEAVVSELVDYFEKEKTCSVEPGGKPCDHCAMCSTRGF